MAKKKKKATKAKKTTAKKSVKKAAKKPAKKVAKKASKKAAPKKAAKKVAKKAAPKKAAAKKAAPKKAAAPKAPKAPVMNDVAPSGPHPLEGNTIPALTVQNHKGETHALPDLLKGNKKVVLYFYPKDDTPGCTMEACDFRDNLNRLQSQGVKVYGISPDSPDSHQKFISKYDLNFDLLSDPEHKLAEEMKVWKEKSFMGKNYMGVERSTFLLDENGKVVKGWQPVKVQGHVDEVIKALHENS